MTTTLDHYRGLAAAFLEPGISETERQARGQVVEEALGDVRVGVGLSDHVLPGQVFAAARSEGELAKVRGVWQTHHELRAILTDLDDTPGLLPRGVVTGSTGLGGGLPFIRSVAIDEPATNTAGITPVLPGIPGTDAATVGVIDPDDPYTDGDVLSIEDVGSADRWHYSAIVATISRQVTDFTTPLGHKFLDDILFDVADRGAEKYIGENLVVGAGGSTAEASDLAAALDTAEAAASAALSAPANILGVNPADWPRVRRVVAQAWQLGPAPTPIVSRGITAGTVILTGSDAFYLFRRDMDVERVTRPKNITTEVAAVRRFYFAVRNEDAIQAVELA